MLYWKRDRVIPDPNLSNLGDSLMFDLLHQDFETSIHWGNFNQHHSYFRLIHKMGTISKTELPSGYAFEVADPVNEAQEISDFIGVCYDDIHPSPYDVLSWCEHPVFDADLWVWIIDEGCENPVGLGIAEFNPIIADGSLEWIQVLPKTYRQGFG